MNESLNQVRALNMSLGGTARLALTPEYLEKRNILRMIVRENLALAAGQAAPGSAEQEEIARLYKEFKDTPALITKPDLIKELYRATGKFGLLEEHGRLGNLEDLFRLEERPETLEDLTEEQYLRLRRRSIKGLRPELYMRGLKNEFGITEGTKELTEAINNLTDEIQKTNTVPVMMPSED